MYETVSTLTTNPRKLWSCGGSVPFLRGGLILRLIAVFFLLFTFVQPFANIMRDYIYRDSDNENFHRVYFDTPFLLPCLGGQQVHFTILFSFNQYTHKFF